MWKRALNVRDAMEPGFKAECIPFWLDQGEEDEHVLEPEPEPEQKHADCEDESSFGDFSDAEVIDNGTRQQPGVQLGSDEYSSNSQV